MRFEIYQRGKGMRARGAAALFLGIIAVFAAREVYTWLAPIDSFGVDEVQEGQTAHDLGWNEPAEDRVIRGTAINIIGAKTPLALLNGHHVRFNPRPGDHVYQVVFWRTDAQVARFQPPIPRGPYQNGPHPQRPRTRFAW